MNSLEAEYSFLTPTWKLPTVSTSSVYPHTFGTSLSTNVPTSGPDWTLWNNTMYNSRYTPSYVPSTNIRRNYPVSTSYPRAGPTIIPSQQNYQTLGDHSAQSGPPYHQKPNSLYGVHTNSEDGLNLTISVHPNNEYESYNDTTNHGQSKTQMVNRGLTYATNNQNNHPPINQKRRVQIIDHNRQTPSTVINENLSERNSRNSNFAPSYTHYTHTPDPHKSQQKSKTPISSQYYEHSDESKHGNDGNNLNVHDYLYGLSAPDPGSYANAYKHHQRRLQDEKLGRKSVVNEYRSFARNGGFGPAFGNTDHHSYEDKIDTENRRKYYSKVVHNTNQYKIEEQKRIQNNNGYKKDRPALIPKYQRYQSVFSSFIPIFAPIIITSLSHIRRHSSLDYIQYSNQNDSLFDEFIIHRARRSLSLPSIIMKRRIHFNSHNFFRHRSNTFSDLPSYIIGKSISNRTDLLSNRLTTQKLTSKLLNRETSEKQINNLKHIEKSSNFSLQTISNKNETKFITSHSMIITKNMRVPPTATIVINQISKPSLIATTSTNNNLKKTTSNKDVIHYQRPLTACSIPDSYRKTRTKLNLDFDLQIKSFHRNASNE
ncbi:unnamed protein product [Rotaria sp. Silwood2]|nr:unnamed protein product [Rotaria sp. Silwood2]CAF3971827.1 unnamed protein product [Rotaria sp. Silwood2]